MVTDNYGFNKPTVGEVGDPNWGAQINDNFDSIDNNLYVTSSQSSGVSTNTNNITSVTDYSSGIMSIAQEAQVMFSTNVDRAPFDAVRIEYGSGLETMQQLIVTEGFDEDNTRTYVQSLSSGLAYQEHVDLVFSKKFPSNAVFGSGGISLNLLTETGGEDENKIVSTVYKNGVAETPETHVTSLFGFTSSLNNDLKAMWNFNDSGNMADSEIGPTTSSYDMLYSGAAYTSNGKYEGGLDFESSSNHYAYTSHSDLHSIGEQTWAILIKPESHAAQMDIFQSWGIYYDPDPNDYNNLKLYLTSGGAFTFWIRDGAQQSKTVAITPSGSAIDDNWWLIVVRVSNNEIKLWVGDITAGTIESDTTVTSGLIDNTHSISKCYLGIMFSPDWGTFNPFDGILDELCVWDVAKSDDDITSLFNNSAMRYYGIDEYAITDSSINNYGTNWTVNDELTLKLEMWSKDNKCTKLYGVDFDLE